MRRATALAAVAALAVAGGLAAFAAFTSDGDLPWQVRTPQLARDGEPAVADPSTEPEATPARPLQISFAVAFPELPSLQRPTNMVELPSRWMLVTLQDGRVVTFPNDPGASAVATVLDLRENVSRAGNEEGLLGLALDPAFAQNGLIYVYYSARPGDRRTVLSRLRTSGAGADLRADPASALIILQVPQPFSNHKGGQVSFGPDGMLYLGLGDGGSQGDPSGNGQDLRRNLLGSILRIDVRNATADKPYAIPPDNPFATSPNGERPETWAYGLRNPWRFSWDRATGRMIAADVGQGDREEIDIIEKGRNYGWNITEGVECYKPSSGCNMAGLTLPVWDYGHDNGNCSVTGGYVYQGKRIPGLAGNYFFADYCSGAVWRLPGVSSSDKLEAVSITSKGPNISSFAQDLAGEVYLLAFDGKIYTVVE